MVERQVNKRYSKFFGRLGAGATTRDLRQMLQFPPSVNDYHTLVVYNRSNKTARGVQEDDSDGYLADQRLLFVYRAGVIYVPKFTFINSSWLRGTFDLPRLHEEQKQRKPKLVPYVCPLTVNNVYVPLSFVHTQINDVVVSADHTYVVHMFYVQYTPQRNRIKEATTALTYASQALEAVYESEASHYHVNELSVLTDQTIDNERWYRLADHVFAYSYLQDSPTTFEQFNNKCAWMFSRMHDVYMFRAFLHVAGIDTMLRTMLCSVSKERYGRRALVWENYADVSPVKPSVIEDAIHKARVLGEKDVLAHFRGSTSKPILDVGNATVTSSVNEHYYNVQSYVDEANAARADYSGDEAFSRTRISTRAAGAEEFEDVGEEAVQRHVHGLRAGEKSQADNVHMFGDEANGIESDFLQLALKGEPDTDAQPEEEFESDIDDYLLGRSNDASKESYVLVKAVKEFVTENAGYNESYTNIPVNAGFDQSKFREIVAMDSNPVSVFNSNVAISGYSKLAKDIREAKHSVLKHNRLLLLRGKEFYRRQVGLIANPSDPNVDDATFFKDIIKSINAKHSILYRELAKELEYRYVDPKNSRLVREKLASTCARTYRTDSHSFTINARESMETVYDAFQLLSRTINGFVTGVSSKMEGDRAWQQRTVEAADKTRNIVIEATDTFATQFFVNELLPLVTICHTVFAKAYAFVNGKGMLPHVLMFDFSMTCIDFVIETVLASILDGQVDNVKGTIDNIYEHAQKYGRSGAKYQEGVRGYLVSTTQFTRTGIEKHRSFTYHELAKYYALSLNRFLNIFNIVIPDMIQENKIDWNGVELDWLAARESLGEDAANASYREDRSFNGKFWELQMRATEHGIIAPVKVAAQFTTNHAIPIANAVGQKAKSALISLFNTTKASLEGLYANRGEIAESGKSMASKLWKNLQRVKDAGKLFVKPLFNASGPKANAVQNVVAKRRRGRFKVKPNAFAADQSGSVWE